MAFEVDFSLTQVWQDKVLTVKDLSNYGDSTASNKDDFQSRTIYLAPASTLEEQAIDWPYDGTPDSVQESIDIDWPADQAFSIRLEVEPFIPNSDTEAIYYKEATAATTGFIDRCRLNALAELDPRKTSKSREAEDYVFISAYRDAALSRASQGDIGAAQRLIDFSLGLCDCKC